MELAEQARDMKQPIESDFDVRNHDAGVDVTFKPTDSQYSFVLRRIVAVSPRKLVTWQDWRYWRLCLR